MERDSCAIGSAKQRRSRSISSCATASLSGALAFGAKLPTENELAEHLRRVAGHRAPCARRIGARAVDRTAAVAPARGSSIGRRRRRSPRIFPACWPISPTWAGARRSSCSPSTMCRRQGAVAQALGVGAGSDAAAFGPRARGRWCAVLLSDHACSGERRA